MIMMDQFHINAKPYNLFKVGDRNINVACMKSDRVISIMNDNKNDENN